MYSAHWANGLVEVYEKDSTELVVEYHKGKFTWHTEDKAKREEATKLIIECVGRIS